MTEGTTDDVLEREKLRYEVDKLQIEVSQLRKPFRQPATVAAIFLGLVTSGAAGIQYQLNQIQAENTKLDIAKLAEEREKLSQEIKVLGDQRAAIQSQLSDGSAAVAAANQQIADVQQKLTALEERLRSESGVRPALYKDLSDSANALRLAAATSEDAATSLDLTQREIKSSRAPRASGLLGSFKVGIYYNVKDSTAKAFAEQVQGALNGNVSITQLYPREQAFFESVNVPMGNEVRYEDPAELPAARELQTLLASRSPGDTFRLRAVGTKTPNFLSIFIDKR
jgi:hypothetical protein